MEGEVNRCRESCPECGRKCLRIEHVSGAHAHTVVGSGLIHAWNAERQMYNVPGNEHDRQERLTIYQAFMTLVDHALERGTDKKVLGMIMMGIALGTLGSSGMSKEEIISAATSSAEMIGDHGKPKSSKN